MPACRSVAPVARLQVQRAFGRTPNLRRSTVAMSSQQNVRAHSRRVTMAAASLLLVLAAVGIGPAQGAMNKNVLGGDLKSCCQSPKTGFYRDGFCRVGPEDGVASDSRELRSLCMSTYQLAVLNGITRHCTHPGAVPEPPSPKSRGLLCISVHSVCAECTKEFLEFSASRGNDLRSIVSPGQRWCLCVSRWKEALDAGVAPPIDLEATSEAALNVVSLDQLKQLALKQISQA